MQQDTTAYEASRLTASGWSTEQLMSFVLEMEAADPTSASERIVPVWSVFYATAERMQEAYAELAIAERRDQAAWELAEMGLTIDRINRRKS